MAEHGWCRLCGRTTALTREHLPPRGAGNDGRGFTFSMETWLQNKDIENLRGGQHYQGGARRPTLCRDCNSFLGREYVPEYIRWSKQSTIILRNAYGSLDPDRYPEGAGVEFSFLDVSPGRFVRQVVSMFLNLAPSPGFRDRYRNLVHLVEHPNSVVDIAPVVIATRLFVGPYTRTTSVMVKMNVRRRSMQSVMEVAFPPFSFVLVLDGDPIEGSLDIAEWTRLRSDQRTNLDFRLPIGFGWTALPADYRSKDVVQEGMTRAAT